MYSYQNIDLTQAKALIESGATIADIRDEASYLQGHIQSAFHLTNQNIDTFIRESDLDNPLLVYCYHGHSSQQAAQFLAEQGFEEVYSLLGGFTDWAANEPDSVKKI